MPTTTTTYVVTQFLTHSYLPTLLLQISVWTLYGNINTNTQIRFADKVQDAFSVKLGGKLSFKMLKCNLKYRSNLIRKPFTFLSQKFFCHYFYAGCIKDRSAFESESWNLISTKCFWIHSTFLSFLILLILWYLCHVGSFIPWTNVITVITAILTSVLLKVNV